MQIELTHKVMADQFTITCDSNSQLQKSIFPDNVMGDFKTRIPEQLLLPNWEVAVSNVVFPENLREKNILRIRTTGGVKFHDFEYDMTDYDDPDRLLDDIELDINAKEKETGISFRRVNSPPTHLVKPGQKMYQFWRKRQWGYRRYASVNLNNTAHKFLANKNHPKRLVFSTSDQRYDMVNEHTLFEEDHISHLYCDIIEPHVVGDMQATLLKILPTFKYKKQSEIQQYEPPVLLFHPLINRGFQSIHLSFYQTSGKKHVFIADDQKSGILVTLLFRPIKKHQ